MPPLPEKGPGLELALKAEPDPVLDGLEDMLEPQPDVPPLDGSEQDGEEGHWEGGDWYGGPV